MRQETTNTFDKGLNKDLNPIVTPNDVLTDCLNGTFITFNGDELVLQNDAGNTKIPTKWDKKMLLDYSKGSSYNKNVIVKLEDGILYRSLIDSNTKPIFNEDDSLNKIYWELFDPSVKLSDGFYPIGIKEYGGVLYIVSANKETNKVEFGSYPSPIYAKHDLYNAEEVIKIINPKEDLYKARVLNDVFFKSGGYILFNSVGDIDVSNLSTLTETKMYKVRLLHKLNNGIFDLTTDVWEKFEDYKTKENSLKVDHWIISGATTTHTEMPFKYFCPNQFRGKLSVVIELDEPKEFSFDKLPKIDLAPNAYKMSFGLKYNGSENIDISGFKGTIAYESEGEEPTFIEGGNEFSVNINKDRKSISYEIYPDTQYEWDAFPEEFKDKFTLRGSLLLEERFHSLYYELAMGDCDISNNYRTYKMLILSNSNGPLGLDMENVREGEKLTVFILDGYSLPNTDNYNILGKFNIVDNMAVIDNASVNLALFETIKEQEEGEILADLIINKVNDTQVIVEDGSCSKFSIFIEFNLAFDLDNLDKVLNNSLGFYHVSGEGRTARTEMVPYIIRNNRMFEVQVDVNKRLQILDYSIDLYAEILPEKFKAGEVHKIGIVTTIENRYIPKTIDGEPVLPKSIEFATSKIAKSNEKLVKTVLPYIDYVSDETSTGSDRTSIGKPTLNISWEGEHYFSFSVTNPKWSNGGEFSGADFANDYVNLPKNKYIKYGDDTLGYVLFNKEDRMMIYKGGIN